MSEKRTIRLLATATTLLGSGLTAYVLTNPDHGLEDGSLFFPVAGIVGVLMLIKNRPGKKHAKN